MRFHRVAVLLCVVLLAGFAARNGFAAPADDDAGGFAAADAQILSEIRDHSEAMTNLEYLSETSGRV